jgi:hypothetical protein
MMLLMLLGLGGAAAADVLARLQPLLPALMQHLQLAINTIKEPPEGSRELLVQGEAGGSGIRAELGSSRGHNMADLG